MPQQRGLCEQQASPAAQQTAAPGPSDASSLLSAPLHLLRCGVVASSKGCLYVGELAGPLGRPVRIAATERAVVQVSIGVSTNQFLATLQRRFGIRPEQSAHHGLLRAAALQLEEYFAGRRRQFQLPLLLEGSPFQMRVWHALQEIPYGETRSYAELARAIGAPRAARAVGAANGANPIAILVPCHRVIRSGGEPGGYGGGRQIKQFLLDLERSVIEGRRPHPSVR